VVATRVVGLLNMVPLFPNCLRSKFLNCFRSSAFFLTNIVIFPKQNLVKLWNFGDFLSVNLINFFNSSMVKIDFSYGVGEY
jgi:hypothetical protein